MQIINKTTATILFIVSLFVIAAFIGFAVYVFFFDKHMAFPMAPRGEFVQASYVLEDDSPYIIAWTLPEECASGGYEVQEVGYTTDNGLLWGGMDADCTWEDSGYVCRAEPHPSMLNPSSTWMIQAKAYGCPEDRSYVSEVVHVRPNLNIAHLSASIQNLQADGGVDLRLLEWMDGAKAEQAALASGDCSLEHIERDECLPNGFFIRDTDVSLSLPLAPYALLRIILPGSDGNPTLRNVDLPRLKRYLEDAIPEARIPFTVTTRNGIIVAIEERYVP